MATEYEDRVDKLDKALAEGILSEDQYRRRLDDILHGSDPDAPKDDIGVMRDELTAQGFEGVDDMTQSEVREKTVRMENEMLWDFSKDDLIQLVVDLRNAVAVLEGKKVIATQKLEERVLSRNIKIADLNTVIDEYADEADDLREMLEKAQSEAAELGAEVLHLMADVKRLNETLAEWEAG